jgi:hypothetical protein
MVAKGIGGDDVEEWLGMNLFYDTEYFRGKQQVADFHNDSPFSQGNPPRREKKCTRGVLIQNLLELIEKELYI